LEKRSDKGGRTEFNKQFHKNMDSRVLRKLTKEEMGTYKRPLNYIPMVEGFKNGPYTTTPLRLCMNCSMNQPPPFGLSLNEYMLKGPPALVDLNMMTLGTREHEVAFTKDI
jgi:hypothetical protein